MTTQVGRLYIVEGPDGAGKTTLCQQIADKWRRAGFYPKVVHASSKPTLEEQYSEAVDALKEGYWPVIMDRSPYSEQVYGLVLRGEVLGSEADWELWEAFRGAFNAVCIRVDADNKVLIERAFGRAEGETFVNQEQLYEIADAYRLQSTYWPHFWHLGQRLIPHFLDYTVHNHIRAGREALRAAARP